eukprot:3730336-Prymnesium_polylepis.2
MLQLGEPIYANGPGFHVNMDGEDEVESTDWIGLEKPLVREGEKSYRSGVTRGFEECLSYEDLRNRGDVLSTEGATLLFVLHLEGPPQVARTGEKRKGLFVAPPTPHAYVNPHT